MLLEKTITLTDEIAGATFVATLSDKVNGADVDLDNGTFAYNFDRSDVKAIANFFTQLLVEMESR